MTFTPSVWNTSSKGPENFESRVADQEPDLDRPLPYHQVPGLLGDPRRVEVPGDAEDMQPPGPDLDDEQHVKRQKQECLDSELDSEKSNATTPRA
jgi:hypothetical protein